MNDDEIKKILDASSKPISPEVFNIVKRYIKRYDRHEAMKKYEYDVKLSERDVYKQCKRITTANRKKWR